MKKNISRPTSIIISLLSFMFMGATYADETTFCTTGCASDLKECQKQAQMAASSEINPWISTMPERKGLGPNEFQILQNEEKQKRRAERNQSCITANSNCLNLCSPNPTSPKISVIFK